MDETKYSDDQIFEVVMDDVRRQAKLGMKIDLDMVGVTTRMGVWCQASGCGVCAIGAALLGRMVLSENDYEDFGQRFGRSFTWACDVADGTLGRDDGYDGEKLGLRLREAILDEEIGA